jgi:hypothetical protein
MGSSSSAWNRRRHIQGWHRRQALVLASQLPDNQHDALMVIEAARELVETFLAPESVESDSTCNVVPVGRGV